MPSVTDEIREAGRLAECGKYGDARDAFLRLQEQELDQRVKAQVANGLGVLAAVDGDDATARSYFNNAMQFDADFAAAIGNLDVLGTNGRGGGSSSANRGAQTRVAILSLLFNWPSTGGGIIHTVELAQFLERAGYEVRLIHPVYSPWRIGQVSDDCPFPAHGIGFSDSEWTIDCIQRRFREAVDAFAPDHVVITDCWNFKPHLARAVEGYSFLLRMQAQECVCPLNNLRLLVDEQGLPQQCENTQLKDAAQCRTCVAEHERFSGGLHRLDRMLSNVRTAEYERELRWAIENASAVLVLNQSVQNLYAPHCRNVRVVTWGMDEARFPWPGSNESALPKDGKARLLFAGLVEEPVKGFRIVEEACSRLWERRRDFELVVTADRAAPVGEFVRCIGWQSQADLPAWYRACDAILVPTIAQDGLSRTAVEAMASGRAVLGSRIGGLADTIVEHVTGLFAEPGDVADWTERIEWLLDHPEERTEMGRAGRRRFEEQYTWERVIREEYVPLLGTAERAEVTN